MKGKEKCEFLKGIRKRMAEANGIPYEPRECTFEGDCTGTCPFCEKEAAELLAKLKEKEAEGAVIKTGSFSIATIKSMHHIRPDEDGKDTLTIHNEVIGSYDDIEIRNDTIRGDYNPEYEEEFQKRKEEIAQELKKCLIKYYINELTMSDEDLETMRKEQEKSALLAMYQQQQATMGVIRRDEEEESRSKMEVEKLMDELKKIIEDSGSLHKEAPGD